MKILFLIPYPLEIAPSQRFRFEQYFDCLKRNHHKFDIYPFLSNKGLEKFRLPGHWLTKTTLLVGGFSKRLVLIGLAITYDCIFIHREVAPLGPPIFEWILARVLRKKVIYDFDDAIWLTDKKGESWIEQKLRWRGKVGSICKWSTTVSCGNQYLMDYALMYNSNVVLNPTTVDTDKMFMATMDTSLDISGATKKDQITIGWTGSYSTVKYLKMLVPVLVKLASTFPNLSIFVIADCKPDFYLPSLIYIPWNKHTETTDLSRIDIGVMPLPDDPWTRGKCGFKAIQYMAMEIPCVISPVGANVDIVENGRDGFLASSEDEWIQVLSRLITNESLRQKIGKSGRRKIVEKYSSQANQTNFLSLFTEKRTIISPNR